MSFLGSSDFDQDTKYDLLTSDGPCPITIIEISKDQGDDRISSIGIIDKDFGFSTYPIESDISSWASIVT